MKETRENKEQVISDKDLDIIRDIAKKYHISVQELGRILSRKTVSYQRLQIMLNQDELAYIDKHANKLNISRTKYCSLCYKKAFKENLFEEMNIIDAVKESNNGRRDYRAVISFDEATDYLEMKKIADDFGIPFSSLVRYVALNVKL